MPNIRCKFYTAAGEPEQGGCRRRGAGCSFVHPNEPGWSSAPPPKIKPGPRSGSSTVGSSKLNRGPPIVQSVGSRSNMFAKTKILDDSPTTVAALPSQPGWDTGGGISTWNTENATTWSVMDVESKSDSPGGWGDSSVPQWGIQNTGQSRWADSSEAGWDIPDFPERGGEAFWTMPSGYAKTSSTHPEEAPPFASTQVTEALSYGTVWTTEKDVNKEMKSMDANNDKEKLRLPSPRVPRPSKNKAHDTKKITGTNQVPIGSKIQWGKKPSNIPPALSVDTNANVQAPISPTVPCPIENPEITSPRPPTLTSQPSIPCSGTDSVDADAPSPSISSLLPSARLKRKRVGLDNKYDIFKEYIKTWERAVRARFYLAEAETKRNRWYRTQKSQCYARIGDAGINILETKRAEFDRECVTQQEKLSASLSALVDYHDSITYGFDLGQRYNVIEEVSNFISESKAFIHQIDVHIRDFKNRDVLVVEPSLDQTWQGSPPLQHEEQAIQSRLEEVDETLEEVHAELTFSHPRNVKEIVDEVFDARIDHLREVRDLEMQQTPLDLDIPLESRQQLKQVMNRWQEAESKLPKTISDISSLITENAQLSRRIEQLEKENVAHYETIAKLLEKRATDDLRQQTQKLQADLEQCILTGRQHHLEPSTLLQHLIGELRPTINDLVQEIYEQEIVPVLKTMGDRVEAASVRKQGKMFRQIWQAIEPAMNAVDGVTRWLDSKELASMAEQE